MKKASNSNSNKNIKVEKFVIPIKLANIRINGFRVVTY